MNIKEAIKALLQTKFGGVQLSDARVEAFAKSLEGKVKDEAELEAKLVVFNEIEPFSKIRSDDDRLRTLEAEAKKKTETKTTTEEKKQEETKQVEQTSEEIPAWAKAIIAGNKAVTEKLSALEGQKIVNDRRGLITSKLKDAGEDYSAKVLRDFGRMSFADDAAFEEYLGDVEKDYATHVQTQAESKLGKDNPFAGVGKDGRVNEATQAEVDQLFGDIKI